MFAALALAAMLHVRPADSAPLQVCRSGGAECMRDANGSTSNGNPINGGSHIAGPDETVVLHTDGNTYKGAATFTIRDQDNGKCFTTNQSSFLVTLQPCNSGGVDYIQVNDKFANVAASKANNGNNQYLTCIGNGFQYSVDSSGIDQNLTVCNASGC